MNRLVCMESEEINCRKLHTGEIEQMHYKIAKNDGDEEKYMRTSWNS